MQDVKSFIEPYVTLDKPIPFKDDLKIHPIKVEDYYLFNSTVDIFAIEKNRIPEVRIIQMNYLQFIVQELFSSTKSFNNYKAGDLWNYKFFTLLSLIFKVDIDNIFIKKDEKDRFFININDTLIDYKEFDRIRKIVFFQNIYDYEDIEMSEDFRRVVEKYFALRNKGMRPLTLEDKIDTILSSTAFTMEDILNMTYRRFCRIFQKTVDKIEYIVGCYGYTRKEVPEHWIYKKDKGKYDMVVTDANSFTDKLGGIKK